MRDHTTELDESPAHGPGSSPLTTLTVTEAMVRHPQTLPVTASVGDAVAALEDDHVHLVLLVDGDRLVGTLARDDLPTGRTTERAVDFATVAGRTISAHATLEEAVSHLRATSGRRLAVVGEGERLLGLLCLKRTGRGFCSDADVSSRRRSRSESPA